MIYEVLQTGKENPTRAADLKQLFSCTGRELRAQIERERRAGKPICASTERNNAGYYIAADENELTDYCNSIRRRAGAMFKTRRALLKTIDK